MFLPGSGRRGGGSAVAAPEKAWPSDEWQLTAISKEDGSEALGCRIVTSLAVGANIQKMFEQSRLPSSMVDDDDADTSSRQDLVYIYVAALHYQRADYLITTKIKQKISPLPPELLDLLDLAKQQQQKPAPNATDDQQPPSEHVPKILWQKLKVYQRDGVRNFLRLNGRMLLGDDPGLGKTLQSIVCALCYRAKWPLLVICPSSVKSNWACEFCKWLDMPEVGFRRSDVRIIESEADALRLLEEPTDADLAATAKAKARAGVNGSNAGPHRTAKRKRPPPIKTSKMERAAQVGGVGGAVTDADVVRRKAAAVKRQQKKLEADQKAAAAPKPVHQVYIISYDLMIRPNVYARVSAKRFKLIIADESHFLRSPDTHRTVSFVGLALRSPHVLELSGTPGHCPEQIYSQVRALQPNLLPPYWVPPPPHVNTQDKFRAISANLSCTFAGRWCDPLPEPTFAGKFTWALNGCARLGELNAILKEFCLLKRTKGEVLKELPEKIRHPIHFEVPLKERQIIETEMALMKGLRQSQPIKYKAKFMSMWNDLPRIKIPAVQEYLDGLLGTTGELGIDPTRKVIIFAHHKSMVLAIEERVTKHKVGFMKITGDTPTAKRQLLVDKFQTDPDVRIAILSLTAAGFGLNLQAANLVIFTELLFSESSHAQGEDRAHRLGQTAKQVICRYLVAKATLDEGLVRMIQRKTTSSALMLEGKHDTFAMKRAEKLALTTDELNEADMTVTEEELEEVAWEEVVNDDPSVFDQIVGDFVQN